jgi:hypothetical protein
MFFTRFILASLTVTTVLSLHEFHALKPNVFPKRQEYKPDSHTCGTGSCEEACGAGYEACGTRVCVNPSLNQVCCQANSAKPCEWCSKSSYTHLRLSAHTSFQGVARMVIIVLSTAGAALRSWIL